MVLMEDGTLTGIECIEVPTTRGWEGRRLAMLGTEEAVPPPTSDIPGPAIEDGMAVITEGTDEESDSIVGTTEDV